MELEFEWDPGKSTINVRKHGVSFEAARSVFYDEHARLIEDPGHSGSEDRFLLLGMSGEAEELVVVHCYRASDERIRIISARKATKRESRQYGEFR